MFLGAQRWRVLDSTLFGWVHLEEQQLWSVLHVQQNLLPLTYHRASYGHVDVIITVGDSHTYTITSYPSEKIVVMRSYIIPLARNIVFELGTELSPSKLGEPTMWTHGIRKVTAMGP